MMTAYERSLKYTEHKLDNIRSRLEKLSLGDAVVLVCGSYARCEASEQSDIPDCCINCGMYISGKDVEGCECMAELSEVQDHSRLWFNLTGNELDPHVAFV